MSNFAGFLGEILGLSVPVHIDQDVADHSFSAECGGTLRHIIDFVKWEIFVKNSGLEFPCLDSFNGLLVSLSNGGVVQMLVGDSLPIDSTAVLGHGVLREADRQHVVIEFMKYSLEVRSVVRRAFLPSSQQEVLCSSCHYFPGV